MFWTERENHRLRLVLSTNIKDTKGTPPINAETQRPSGVFDGAWLGGYLDLAGHKGTQEKPATDFRTVADCGTRLIMILMM